MMNAYEILNIPFTEDDTMILTAYLKRIREFPPEKAPLEFEKICAAYEAIRDERKRIHYELFNVEETTKEDVLQALIHDSPPLKRLTHDQILGCIEDCLEEKR